MSAVEFAHAMTDHESPASTPHGQPAPVDKPKRRWRMTKADYERVIAEQAQLVEQVMQRNEYLTENRNAWRDEVDLLLAQMRADRAVTSRWRLACLALATACAVLAVW